MLVLPWLFGIDSGAFFVTVGGEETVEGPLGVGLAVASFISWSDVVVMAGVGSGLLAGFRGSSTFASKALIGCDELGFASLLDSGARLMGLPCISACLSSTSTVLIISNTLPLL